MDDEKTAQNLLREFYAEEYIHRWVRGRSDNLPDYRYVMVVY
ncbi:hypothetical protein CHRY9390_01623 [Chryseobacterium aquaeductus]|uniref:Uncharacterized protein n=1 Tax=Chryseobacterium aquaeductus TaxID=2675056 RepID=A0A9N8QSF3_9FLAO|nr:hypothetical protein CHRY9390_01623 [Chryseobacterium potabilaquae]CAD7807186.1 hypothetical protein CHRY9390_01623 [Chryseobacterium aquaeductus]